MLPEDYIRCSEAAKLLCVTTQTVRKYHREGKITGYTTPGRQTVYSRKQIINLLNENNPQAEYKPPEKLAFYVRASDGDKAKIKTQIELLTEKYGEPLKIYKDSASGLNEKRKGLHRMLKDAKEGVINTIRYTQDDRLTRFGSEYLEELLREYGCDVQAAFETRDKSLEQELMDDFMSLIASFSGKFYRLRGYKQKKQLLDEANKRLEDSQDDKK